MKKLSIPIGLLSRYSWTPIQFLHSYYISGKKVDVLGFTAKARRFSERPLFVSPRVIQAP
jgi:hypothetical protein